MKKVRLSILLLVLALAVSLLGVSAVAEGSTAPREEVKTESAVANKTSMKVTLSGNVKAGLGKKVSFSVKVSKASGKVTYQWQESANGKKWTASKEKGAKTKKLTLTVAESTFDKQYRCVVKDSKGKVTTKAVRVNAPFTLSVSPAKAELAAGKTAKFTVKAKGTSGSVKYQWMYSEDGGKTWKKSKLSTASKNALKVKVSDDVYGQLFRCEVSDKNGKLVTDSVYAEPAGAGDFTYKKSGSEWAVTGYKGKDENPSVPAGHQGLKVTSIAAKAFRNNKSISSVGLPGTVTEIGASAFQGCEALEWVYIPDGVTSIGKNAFAGIPGAPMVKPATPAWTAARKSLSRFRAISTVAKNDYHLLIEKQKDGSFLLTEAYGNGGDELNIVQIPDGVDAVGERAFAESPVREVYLSDTVKFIYPAAFEACAGLEKVEAAESAKLEKIGINAFKDCGALNSIYLPPSLREIGDNAFENCTALKDLWIPDQVKSVGFSAFNGTFDNLRPNVNGDTPALTALLDTFCHYDVWYPDYHLWIDNLDGEQDFGGFRVLSNSFTYDGSQPTKIVVPDTIEVIYHGALSNPEGGLSSVKEIVLPASVHRIGRGAFEGLDGLETVNLDHVMFIQEAAFKGCSKLNGISFSESLDLIGDHAFAGCTALRDLFLPDGIKSIGFSAFDGLSDYAVSFQAGTDTMAAAMQTALNYDIWYDTYHLWVKNHQSGKYAGYAVLDNSFTYDGSKPTEITIPEGIEVIAVDACASNEGQYSQVKTVNLPSSVGILDEGAFRDCSGLTDINLNNVCVIGEGAFLNCSSLGDVTLKGDVGTITLEGGFAGIGQNAFSGCTNLRLHVQAGMYAETYAQEHDIPYVTY